MDEVLAYLKENPTYFLATVDADGNPQVRPFGTIAKFEGKLYIQTGKVKPVSDQMIAHPRVAISAVDTKGGWLRLEADAVLDDRVEAREAVPTIGSKRARPCSASTPSCRTCTRQTTATARYLHLRTQPPRSARSPQSPKPSRSNQEPQHLRPQHDKGEPRS